MEKSKGDIFKKFLLGMKSERREKTEKSQKRASKQKQPVEPEPLNIKNMILVRTLGTGSFGRVFLAKNSTNPNGQPIAVKRLKKAVVIRQKQVDHILSEKKILAKIYHPFVVNLLGTFKDDRYLFIAMEYVIGGEFFTYLRRIKRCKAEAAKFYAAQIVLIFEYLHAKDIVYRDLKPENLLLDHAGYLKLTDFGFAKVVESRTYTICGTPEYIAPEILLSRGHGKPVDWWTLGILVYEMIVGYPPFFENDPMGVYQKILSGRIAFPSFFEREAKLLVKHFLTADLTKRYGNLRNGVQDIKNHVWFESFDWQRLLQKQLTPPYVPTYKSPDDASNFDTYPESVDTPKPVTEPNDPFSNW